MWVPASESHAIENVGVTFIFSEQLPIKYVKSASNYADSFLTSGKYSSKKEIYESNFEIEGPEARSKSSELVGYSYSQKDLNEEAVRFQKDFAYFSAVEYGTWKAFSQEAYEVLGPYLTQSLEITEIESIKLEYFDRFVFEGKPSDADFSEILETSGLGLPEEAIKNGMPWHDRKGWFEILDVGPILINSNILATEVLHRDRPENPLMSVQIITVIETKFSTHMNDYDNIKSVMEALHDKSKETLRSLITDHAAKMVGMQ